VPLPPYIARTRPVTTDALPDGLFAPSGAVAAPTAGLHFDLPLLAGTAHFAGVELAWVTLHVGAGTFQPVQTEDIAAHRMHAERYRIPADTVAAVAGPRSRGRVTGRHHQPARARSGRRIRRRAACRKAETALFIRPGYRFAVVDRLLTNFTCCDRRC
jgi:S-adenosylmethionine:tRNA ribosyltransferase-isomerase